MVIICIAKVCIADGSWMPIVLFVTVTYALNTGTQDAVPNTHPEEVAPEVLPVGCAHPTVATEQVL